jgi:hypothetical protein
MADGGRVRGTGVRALSTIMRWFPERRGLASGMAATSFGMGAVVRPPPPTQLLPELDLT